MTIVNKKTIIIVVEKRMENNLTILLFKIWNKVPLTLNIIEKGFGEFCAF